MLGTLFSFILNILKWTFFTLLVLVGSHLVHWRGRTISEHVRSGLDVVGNSVQPARDFAAKAADGAKSGIHLGILKQDMEKISAEERARLEKLLHQ